MSHAHIKTASKAADGIPYYTPAQTPPVGTPADVDNAPTLFRPLKIRDVTLQHRITVSPMCMYSASNGHTTDWHLVHVGQFALNGASLVIMEATAVEPRGRISPEDSGLWQDSQIEPLKRITTFIHSQGQKAGIQLAHAGRKASTMSIWNDRVLGRVLATPEEGGWADDVVAPSAIPFADGYATPKEISLKEIKEVVQKFADSAKRAVEAGFDVIEIHGAHGYLISEFLSPLSNQRTDDYGGSFENRTRLLFEVVQAVRAVIPTGMPLFLRVSATEWMEYAGKPSWDLESTIKLAKLLPALGVDLLDVSSGGNNSKSNIKIHTNYQVDLAGAVRDALKADGLKLLIGAVGFITKAEMAYSLVQDGKLVNPEQKETVEVDGEHGQKTKADLVIVARQFLRESSFVLKVAEELGVQVKYPWQYDRVAPKHLVEKKYPVEKALKGNL